MLLEQLRDFEWLNEPEDVSFSEEGMSVTAKKESDFWQNTRKNVHADNGHFFFVRCEDLFIRKSNRAPTNGNFTLQ